MTNQVTIAPQLLLPGFGQVRSMGWIQTGSTRHPLGYVGDHCSAAGTRDYTLLQEFRAEPNKLSAFRSLNRDLL